MPGIYSRDQINYGGMLGNAMQARANQIQRDYDNYMKQPLAWANAVNQTGQTINDAFKLAAQYSHDDSKLAAQQQFQAEQNAKNLAEQLNRAREQQAWQARQNDLQRASTERIAEMNYKNSAEDRTAQNIMNYRNAEAVFNQYQTEFDNTDATTLDGIMKRAKLKSLMEQEQNKMRYYEGKIPFEFRRKPEGTPVITGDDAEKALTMFDTEQPQTQADNGGDTRAPAVQMADYISAGDNAKTSTDVSKAIEGLNSIDSKRLTAADQQKLTEANNKLIAKLAKLKKEEEFAAKVRNWKQGEPVPAGYQINFVNGQIAGLKKKSK